MNLRKFVYSNHWTLGFIEQPLSDFIEKGLGKVRWMDNPYSDRWFADPFILDVTDTEVIVLVEEFDDNIRRGRLSRVTIDRRACLLKDVEPFLELPSHLSFPAIRRDGDRIFIYPENGNANTLDLYEYFPTSNECKKIRQLIEEPLADAIWSDLFGEDLIFTTHQPTHNGNELDIYGRSNDVFEKRFSVIFPQNVARNAGDWFKIGDTVYRPAQDCSKVYGGAVIIQRVEKIGNSFQFTDVLRIEEKYGPYDLGCHTFNHFKGVSVIDVNGYRHPFLAKAALNFARLRRR